ncbi:Monothiol glutaredoxin-6, partial [Tolypocladium ophioglossoides CBS 100239]
TLSCPASPSTNPAHARPRPVRPRNHPCLSRSIAHRRHSLRARAALNAALKGRVHPLLADRELHPKALRPNTPDQPATMPSPRRLRLLMLATIVTVILILLYTSGFDAGKKDSRTIQDFYHKTMDGMSKGGGTSPGPGQPVMDSKTGNKAGHIPADKDGDGDVDDDDKKASARTKERLKAAEQRAKDQANEKALRPDPPSEVVGKGNSAEGQVKKVKSGSDTGSTSKGKDTPAPKETKEEHEAEVEMNSILKKAPVIIFSKSYCHFSKRAKGILLEKYTISPVPYVVELDEHPLGKSLQDHLKAKTGRKTVPNIMVNGVSMGGSDEIVELDNTGRLADKIRDLGNKRVEFSERFSTGSHHV